MANTSQKRRGAGTSLRLPVSDPARETAREEVKIDRTKRKMVFLRVDRWQ